MANGALIYVKDEDETGLQSLSLCPRLPLANEGLGADGALTADEIAQTARFFSSGTNDLTQTCLGMSRDDPGSFVPAYQENEIVKTNPLASIDQAGAGELMKIAVKKGQATRPGIKLGICGEHGGDPASG